MGRMQPPGPPRIRLKAERLGDTAEHLAVLLAESFRTGARKRRDGDAYRQQVANERLKAGRLNDVLFQLAERRRNPPARIRRMDPLAEYDEGMVKAELKLAKDRSQNFQTMSDGFIEEAEREDRKAAVLQTRIQKLNKTGKQREALEIIGTGPA